MVSRGREVGSSVRLGRVLEQTIARHLYDWQSVAPRAPRRQSRWGSFVQPCVSLPLSLPLSICLSSPLSLSQFGLPFLSLFSSRCYPLPSSSAVSTFVSSAFACHNDCFFCSRSPLSAVFVLPVRTSRLSIAEIFVLLSRRHRSLPSCRALIVE